MLLRRYRGTVLFFLALACTTILRADSYSYRIVDYTQDENFVGITTAGTFIVNESNLATATGSCGPLKTNSTCFATYYAGSTTPVYSVTAPKLSFDNGISCAPATADFSVLGGACNDGHEIFGGDYYNGTLEIRGVWTGPGVYADFLEPGSFDGGYINSLGDAVFIDGLNNTLVFAEDLSTVRTPEPATLWSLAAGALLVFTLFRRTNRPHTLGF